MLQTSLNKYAQVNEGSKNVGNRSEVSRQISRADIVAGCAKILSKWRYHLWGLKEKGIRRKAALPRREERHEGGRQNWNFFARATTQQLIKSLNVSLSGWCCCCCSSLVFFSQYKLPLPSLRLSIDYRVFLHSPWYGSGSTPSPLGKRGAYGWQLLPWEIRGFTVLLSIALPLEISRSQHACHPRSIMVMFLFNEVDRLILNPKDNGYQ